MEKPGVRWIALQVRLASEKQTTQGVKPGTQNRKEHKGRAVLAGDQKLSRSEGTGNGPCWEAGQNLDLYSLESEGKSLTSVL